MKKIIITLGAVSVIGLTGCNEAKQEPVAPKTFEEKVSYSIGVNVAMNVNVNEFDFSTAAFSQAIEDVRAGKEIQLSEEEMQATMKSYQAKMREISKAKTTQKSEENKVKGLAFLAEKEQEEGVVKTESGLLYKVISAGEGAIPKATDKVLAHYRGSFINGEEFDSSYSRGEPTTFPVGGLIPGWVEALQMMPVGSKWELYIPSELAYGERGNPRVEPYTVLVFELELLDIVKPEADTDTKDGVAK